MEYVSRAHCVPKSVPGEQTVAEKFRKTPRKLPLRQFGCIAVMKGMAVSAS
jgi:hypothetical protein